MQYEHIKVPADGLKITINPDASINVPDHPIVPFIEGDGIGIDLTPVMLKVVNAAVHVHATPLARAASDHLPVRAAVRIRSMAVAPG